MTPARAVVDASVLVALLLDRGARGEAIAARLRSTQLHAPDHVAIEVMRALRHLRIAGNISDSEATLGLSGFWAMHIQVWKLELLGERTWQLGHNLSTYDAAYVALAERLDAPLLTVDARLARASGRWCAIEVFDGAS